MVLTLFIILTAESRIKVIPLPEGMKNDKPGIEGQKPDVPNNRAVLWAGSKRFRAQGLTLMFD